MADLNNLIPSINARGRFEALSPFTAVVDVNTYYEVSAIRTIDQMQSEKENLYEKMFKPTGMTPEDGQKALVVGKEIGAVVVCLVARNKPVVYVLSSYFKSFPTVDGVSYERMCIICDMGSVPPEFDKVLADSIQHIGGYLETKVGITPLIKIGTVPTIGYVSSTQHEVNETTRKNKITNTDNDVSRVTKLEADLVRSQNEVAILEQKVIELSKK